MSDRVVWLRAQLDEDERVAQRMIDAVWPVAVHVVPTEDTGSSPRGLVSAAPGVPKRYQRMWDGGQFEHGWVVHESAVEVWSREVGEQLLREVAAKRAIVDEHSLDHGGEVCADCWRKWPCKTVRHLASVYADRDGYREEWAP